MAEKVSLVYTYEAALRILAQQGNELAKQTLDAVVSVDGGPNLPSVSNYNREATNYLAAALAYMIDSEEEKAVECIKTAIDYIGRATSNLIG